MPAGHRKKYSIKAKAYYINGTCSMHTISLDLHTLIFTRVDTIDIAVTKDTDSFWTRMLNKLAIPVSL